jgi:hypothetical protein
LNPRSHFSDHRKYSSRTNCPRPAHPASRIFPPHRARLIHGARRQNKTRNQRPFSPRASTPPPYPNPCPPLLTLLTSPKMTINLASSPRPPLLSHDGPGALKPRRGDVFLIANPRLKSTPSHRKRSLLEIPNRERIAVFHLIPGLPRLASRRQPPRLSTFGASTKPSHRALPTLGFLIVTLELKIPVKLVETILSKFLIVTKRGFASGEQGSPKPQPLCSSNFIYHQRNEQCFRWHKHSCLPRGTKGLCVDKHQPPRSNHHLRTHFTFESRQPQPQLQPNVREQPEAA